MQMLSYRWMIETLDDFVEKTGDEEALAWYEQTQLPVFAWSSQARGFFSGRYAQRLSPIIRQREINFRMRQSVVSNQIREVITLGGFRAQKLSSRRRIEKQITHGDRGPARMRRVFHIAHAAAFNYYASSGSRVVAPRNQFDAGD